MEKTHRDGLDLVCPDKSLDPLAHLVEGKFGLDAAIEMGALPDFGPVGSRHDRLREPEAQVARLVALLLADIQGVSKSLCDQHAGDGALAFYGRIGDKGRSVQDRVDPSDLETASIRQLLGAAKDGLGRVPGRGRDLVDGYGAVFVIDQDKVGEGAADIDAKTMRHMRSFARLQ